MYLFYITSCIIVWSGHTWLQKIAHRPRLGSGVEDVKAEKFCLPPWKQCQWWECGFIVPNYFLVFLITRLQFLLRVITLLSWGKRTQLLSSCCLVVSVITWLHAWPIGSSFPNHSLILCWWVIHVFHVFILRELQGESAWWRAHTYMQICTIIYMTDIYVWMYICNAYVCVFKHAVHNFYPL